jgi:hypothetical protein
MPTPSEKESEEEEAHESNKYSSEAEGKENEEKKGKDGEQDEGKRETLHRDEENDQTEYDEDGQEICDMDIAEEDDVYPLTPEEVLKIQQKLLKEDSVEPKKRKTRKPTRFAEDSSLNPEF